MKPKAHTLFHYTTKIETLKLILETGFWPQYCLEDLSWSIYKKKFPYVAYPMVCFCDIPLSRIQEHIKKYGSFGLGLKKEWAERNGLNPIMYVSLNSEITKSFNLLNQQANESKDIPSAKNTMRYLYSHIKPLNGTTFDGIERDFYQESEWRYVPNSNKIEAYIKKEDFSKKEHAANKKTKKYSLLEFTPNDINYIFVKSEKYIPEIIKFIETKMTKYEQSDLKLLMSKVISLEAISRDL